MRATGSLRTSAFVGPHFATLSRISGESSGPQGTSPSNSNTSSPLFTRPTTCQGQQQRIWNKDRPSQSNMQTHIDVSHPLSGAAALETQTHPNTGQRNHAGADISFTLMSACHTKCQDSTKCTRTTAAQTPDRQQGKNGCETPIPVPELQGGDVCSSLPLDKHRGMPAACHLHHPYPTLHLSNATTRQMPCKASPSRGLTPHPLAYLVCLIQFENLPQ